MDRPDERPSGGLITTPAPVPTVSADPCQRPAGDGSGTGPLPAALDAGALEPYLRRCDFPPPGEAVTCAVSGGPDSLALLVLAAAANLKVTAVYVDHGLRPTSGDDAAVVAAAAASLGAEFRCEPAAVAAGPNLEARARKIGRAHV